MIYQDINTGGLQFDTMDVGQMPLYASVTMLFVDFILYGLLAVYFDKVVPGLFLLSP